MTLAIRTLRDADTARYTQAVTLDGRVYVMALDFNSRDEHWYLTLSDSDGEPIQGCVGRKLVANWPVLRSTAAARPPGELVVSGGDDVDPGLLDLGKGQTLYYVTAAELGRQLDFFGVV